MKSYDAPWAGRCAYTLDLSQAQFWISFWFCMFRNLSLLLNFYLPLFSLLILGHPTPYHVVTHRLKAHDYMKTTYDMTWKQNEKLRYLCRSLNLWQGQALELPAMCGVPHQEKLWSCTTPWCGMSFYICIVVIGQWIELFWPIAGQNIANLEEIYRVAM